LSDYYLLHFSVFVSSVLDLILGFLEGFGLGLWGRLSPPIAEGEGRGKRRRKKDGKPRRAWLGVGQRGNVEK
jgi:hypothetical protein